jgi:hypothetical protein
MAGIKCLVFLSGRNSSLHNVEMAVGFKYLRLPTSGKNLIYTHPQNISLNYVWNYLICSYRLYSDEIIPGTCLNDAYKGDKQNYHLLWLKSCN